MLTTLSSFVACSPGSSENWEKWGWKWSKRGEQREKEMKQDKRKRDTERVNLWNGILDRLWENRGGKQRRKRGKRTWCKHLLITFCRIDTHTSYSVTRVRGGGDNSMWMYATTDMLYGCSDMHEPAWRDLGVTHDLWQHQDVSQLLSTKRKLGHQTQHGAHSSTSLTFTNPLSVHSHNICPALFIFFKKYSH